MRRYLSGSLLTALFVLGIQQTLLAQINSLYSDVRARQVGDVLTVLISESTSGSSISKNNSSHNSGFDLKASASGSIAASNPSFGGSAGIGSDYAGQNGAEQKDKLLGMVTVRIMEITENGTLKIEGERNLEVNGEETMIHIKGFVRVRDISTENRVYSYNIADAEITYRQDAITDIFMKSGQFSKFFSYLIGGLMVVAAAGYFAFSQ
jgi:flagellar L-ring protein precursor FlgH